jgi:hypothetical protein
MIEKKRLVHCVIAQLKRLMQLHIYTCGLMAQAFALLETGIKAVSFLTGTLVHAVSMHPISYIAFAFKLCIVQ